MNTSTVIRTSVLALATFLLPGCGDVKMPDISLPGSDSEAETVAEAEPATPPEREPVLPPEPTITPEQVIASIKEKPSMQITDADLANLASLKSGREQIQELDLQSATVSSNAFQSMLALPQLRKLNLQATRLSDGHWLPLSQIQTLEWLNLTRTGINNSVLPHVAGLQNLKHLNLSETFINDEGFAVLAPLTSLEEVNVSATDVNGTFLEHLGSSGAKAKLTKIQAGRSNFGYQGFVFLKQFPSLTELYASGVSATDASMEGLQRMNSLAVLELEGNKITDLGIPQIAKCGGLRELSLQDNGGVTDRSLRQLARIKKLEKLNLNGTSCTVAGVQKLKSALPDCVIQVQKQEF